MSKAKQTAMDEYGLTEWPETHIRTPVAVDCRAHACVILQKEGWNTKQIADEIGFKDIGNVNHAIRRFKSKSKSPAMRRNKRITELEQALRDVMVAVGYLTARDVDERKEPYYMRAVALLKGVK